MAESHFTEISNVIMFYEAHAVTAAELLALAPHEFGPNEHQLAETLLATIDEHPGAVPDYALADTLDAEGLDKLIALMTQVAALEIAMVRYVRRLERRVKAYEESL